MNKTNELRATLTAAILAMTEEERQALLALVEGREKTGEAEKRAGGSPEVDKTRWGAIIGIENCRTGYSIQEVS